jgi:hypothetical protein
MTWDPPQPEPLPPPQPVEQTKKSGRFKALWIVAAAVVAFLVTQAALRGSTDDNSRGTGPTQGEPRLTRLIRAQCPSQPSCGIEADTVGPPFTFTLLPDADERGYRAFGIWASETGCLEEVDFDRIGQTRALDGMVRSANGRSTWTYHPDSGLSVVCG